VAEGVVKALHDLDVQVPVVVRLSGTNVEEGRRILAESDVSVITAETLEDAGNKAVAAVSWDAISEEAHS
jgi:malate-CoA ligase subunit beta